MIVLHQNMSQTVPLKHLGRQFMKLDNPDDFAGLVKKALE